MVDAWRTYADWTVASNSVLAEWINDGVLDDALDDGLSARG